MARVDRARAENVSGDFFVDESCIDCDVCRWVAPAVFDSAGEMSRVHHQPSNAAEEERALLALVACPTSSIGTREHHPKEQLLALWPERVAPEVWHLGYHSEASFGAAAYLVERPDGNVMVDVPRFARPLVERVEQLGGVRTIFLTHQDDLAGHERWAERFGAERILHAEDRTAGTQAIERWIEGEEPVELAPGLLAIPVPGHTRGSMCLLHAESVLFTGDHLAWSARLQHLYAFRSACWYDWGAQRRSMERLRRFEFEWVLPGHGRRRHASRSAMRADLERCIAWMGTFADDGD
jgi:glyoxylase-like metal-dependent hydrolase (beta-lactamase superfamily II)/ferredoxin